MTPLHVLFCLTMSLKHLKIFSLLLLYKTTETKQVTFEKLESESIIRILLIKLMSNKVLFLTEKGEGFSCVGDSICEHQTVSSFQNVSDQTTN